MRTPSEVEKYRARGGLSTVELLEAYIDFLLVDPRECPTADGCIRIPFNEGSGHADASISDIEAACDKFRSGGWEVTVRQASDREGIYRHAYFKAKVDVAKASDWK